MRTPLLTLGFGSGLDRRNRIGVVSEVESLSGPKVGDEPVVGNDVLADDADAFASTWDRG